MIAELKRAEVITDWTNCWFGSSMTTGYVVVTDFKSLNKSYGAKDIKAIKRDTEGQERRFISLNAFEFGSRRTGDLKQIRNIGIDLDQYKYDLSIDEALDELQVLILDKKIPEPNIVLSSRGVQIFYNIEGGASPNMSWLVSYITDQYISKMKAIGADSNAKDLSRVMRVPYSINERNGAEVKCEVWRDVPYSLKELQSFCKPLEQFNRKGKKTKAKVIRIEPSVHDKVSLFYRTNHVRLTDLERLVELRDGDLTGKRNIFLYVYAYHQSLICDSYADTESFLFDVFERIHSRTDKPMSKGELKRTIKSAYKDAQEFFEHLKGNGYKVIKKQNDGIKKPYRTDNLIEILDVTEDEQRAMKRLMNSSVKREKDTERKQKERRAAGVKPKEEYNKERQKKLTENLATLNQLLERDMNKTEIAEEMGISRNHVYRLLKELKV